VLHDAAFHNTAEIQEAPETTQVNPWMQTQGSLSPEEQTFEGHAQWAIQLL